MSPEQRSGSAIKSVEQRKSYTFRPLWKVIALDSDASLIRERDQASLRAQLTVSLSLANNRSAQKLLCCNAFISVMKAAELWNCDDLSNLQRLSRKRTLLIEA